jgi:hypothetical protein
MRGYLEAVLKHWKAFVVTSIPGGVLAFVAMAAGLSVPVWWWLAIVGIGLVVASARAGMDLQAEFVRFREQSYEREAALLAQIDVRERRKATREALGDFLRRGEELRLRIEAAGAPISRAFSSPGVFGLYNVPAEDDDATLAAALPDAVAWEADVARFMAEYLGGSYVAVFRSQVGTVQSDVPRMGSDRHTEAWITLDRRLQVLSSILKEVGEDLVGA